MTLNYDHIDELLNQKGMSRRKLARELGISESTFTSSFNRHSKKPIPFETAEKIANILNAPLEEVVNIAIINLAPSETDTDFEKRKQLADSFLAQLRDMENDRLLSELELWFEFLNLKGKEKAIDFVRMISKIPEYQENGEREEINNGNT